MTSNYSFLSKSGTAQYYVFEDKHYLEDGVEKNFSSLRGERKEEECLCIAFGLNSAAALVSSLNFYFKYYIPEIHG